MYLSARVVARSSRPTTASTDTSFLVASLITGSAFEKKDGFVQLKEEGRHPLPSQSEIYYLLFNKNTIVFFLCFFCCFYLLGVHFGFVEECCYKQPHSYSSL